MARAYASGEKLRDFNAQSLLAKWDGVRFFSL